jgi:hypothetical protein
MVAAACGLLVLVWRGGAGDHGAGSAAALAGPDGGASTPRPDSSVGLVAASPASNRRPTKEREGAALGGAVGDAGDAAVVPAPDVLRGVLVRPDGGPTGAGHVVALLELDGDGAPRERGGRVTVAPDARGRFELQLPEWAYGGPVALVGRAWHLHPATLTLRFARGTPHEDVVLTLEEGAILRGRLTNGGVPLAGWPIDLDLRFGVPGVFGAGEEAFWLAGRLVEKQRRATTDVDGRFSFTGLVADRYDLRCGRAAPSIPSVHTQVVVIDGSSLEIDLASAELEVTVLGAGGTLEGTHVVVACEAGETRFRSGEGATILAVPAFAEVTLRAEHATHATLEERTVVGAVGSRSAVLLVLSPTVRATLRVWLPGAYDAGLQRLVLDLLPLSGSGQERRIELARGTAHDEFWLAALPAAPGAHALRLPSTGDFRSEVCRLDVPEAGVAEIAFTGARGGRYRIDISSSLATWRADWRVVDEEGRTVGPDVHRAVDGSGESFEWSEDVGDERTLRPDTSVVPPGRYRLEVGSDEHVHLSREFEVVVGETTNVSVRLAPK